MGTQPRDPNRFAIRLFAPLPARYDLLGEIFSFGKNAQWRQKMIDRILVASPKRILDVATGTAGVAIEIARRSDAEVIGIDITEEMLRLGRERVAHAGLDGRVRLVAGRAEDLPFPAESFDALTFTYLLRYVADPAATIVEMARVLKPGGRMASLEFGVPDRFWFLCWWLYTRGVLPVAALPFGRGWYRVGRFLGPSISGHYRRYPIEWHVHAWRDAGMVEVGYARMSRGGGIVMWGTKAGG